MNEGEAVCMCPLSQRFFLFSGFWPKGTQACVVPRRILVDKKHRGKTHVFVLYILRNELAL
jgi:hypothetical protein